MRSLWRSPGFTLAAVLTLAAGIAAVVAMFTVYWAVVLDPVRLPDAASVVSVARVAGDGSLVPTSLSWPRVQAMQRDAHAFAAIGAYENDTATLSGGGQLPRELRGIRVSSGFFDAIRAGFVRGRPLNAGDDVPNGPAVCVLSYEAWQGLLGGREIVGQPIRLNGRSTEVVGILAPRLSAPWGDRDIFLPRVFDDSQLTPQLVSAGASYLSVVARLAKGRTIPQAEDELRALTRAFAAQFAGRSDTLSDVQVQPLAAAVVANRGTTLTLLVGAVLIVLLVACANAAALVTSRLASRHRELAVRQALGATRVAIVKQVLAESVTVAALAGAAGVFLAGIALSAIRSALGNVLPPGAALRIEGPALLAAVAAVAGATLLVGVLPALQATRASSSTDAGLISFARGMSEAAATQRFRRMLVIAEVALSAFLLVCAALFIASLERTQRTPLGFDPSGVAAGNIALPPDVYPTADRQRAFYVGVLERLQRQPQVRSAAIVFGLPFATDNFVSPYVIAGRNIPPPAARARAGLRIVTEDYFSLMRMRLIAGRPFTSADRDGAAKVCIINESLAKREFAGRQPIGAAILRGREADQPFEIVGIVADVKTNGPNAPAPAELFLPFRQVPRPGASLVVRTDARPETMAPVLQSAVAASSPDLAVSTFGSMEEQLSTTIGPERILAGLATVFAAIALLLATIGLYAVLAHAVTARTVEIGIRMAVGAGQPSILRLIVSGAMRLVAIGIAIGLLAAAAASRLLAAQLHDVSARDPRVYGVVAAIFTAVGMAASIVPARRACRVDPAVSLTQ